jgi:hypothetical protein
VSLQFWTPYLPLPRVKAYGMQDGVDTTDFSGRMIRDDPNYRKLISNITALGHPGEPDTAPFPGSRSSARTSRAGVSTGTRAR